MRSIIKQIFLLLVAPAYCTHQSYAQQDPQFSQYFLNRFMYNPAYAGIDNAISTTVHVRTQWVGIDGNPLSENGSIHTPISLLHGGGGIQVLNEQEGAMRVTSASLSYSFIHKSRAGKLSFGVNGGMIQASLDGNKLRAPDGNYENSTIEHNDPILPVVIASGLTPDFAAGIFFSSNKLNLGLSATHLVPFTIKFNSNGESLEMDVERQYYFQGSYKANISRSIDLMPSCLIKSNGYNMQAEADVVFMYDDFVWIGGGVRGYNNTTSDGVIALAGIRIAENFRVGYSYDYTLSALKEVSDGSHELVLNYTVNLVKPAKPGKAIYNPRF